MILVSDNVLRAQLDFPDAVILTRLEEVEALAPGAEIVLATYRVGFNPVSVFDAARLRLMAGTLIQASPERPLG